MATKRALKSGKLKRPPKAKYSGPTKQRSPAKQKYLRPARLEKCKKKETHPKRDRPLKIFYYLDFLLKYTRPSAKAPNRSAKAAGSGTAVYAADKTPSA